MKNLISILCLFLVVVLGTTGCTTTQKTDDLTEQVRPLAEKGHARAQFYYGLLRLNFWRLSTDFKTPMRWFRLAAEQHFAPAQIWMGAMYEQGWGVPRDYKTALKWYRLAAEQGNAEAHISLAKMYSWGRGVPKNYKVAAEMLAMSSKQMLYCDFSSASKEYREGNYRRAASWYLSEIDACRTPFRKRLAAKQGYIVPNCSFHEEFCFISLYRPGGLQELERIIRVDEAKKKIVQRYGPVCSGLGFKEAYKKWFTCIEEQRVFADLKERRAKEKAKQERLLAEARDRLVRKFSPTCKGLGIKLGSPQMTVCIEEQRVLAEAKERRALAKAEERRRIAEAKAKEERRIAEEKAEEQRRLATEKAKERRLAAEKAEERRRIAEAKAKEERRIAEVRADIIRRFQPKCAAFGFKVGSNRMATCMFDLYKIELEKAQKRAVSLEQEKQNRAAIEAENANAAARAAQIDAQNRLIREQLKEQQKQREIDGLLELGRQGLEMMQPPKPALTCTYNPFLRQTTCN